ncbi:hypothetical protein IW261DRAFT_1571923 [Armillaria novae-zelandiae]|uniref:Uncharacterized protein n=1 Tax=Armillaria novae-zelandiae TaxID=153914 RepID=A0AA39NTN4_9AGAR|nr:hypothetical protein IW261DRAFT_1571923 [Armillaria novae-zelandiae]
MPPLAIADLLNPAQATALTTPTGSDTPELLLAGSRPFKIENDVRINQRTRISILYHHKGDEVIEYPETTLNSDTSVGYLLHMARTDKPFNPVRNIAYSAGKPSGQSKGHKYSVMLGRDGKPVPCLVDYSTCQGVRICPFVSDDIKITSHTEGSRVALQLQLDQRNAGRAYFTAEEEILNKTIAWFRFITDNGCGYTLQEATEYNEQERAVRDHIQLTPTKAKRGQKTKKTCQGRIIIREQSYICCEHYGSFSRKHFVLYPARGGGYNFEYLCALIVNDEPVISKIELQAHQQGYGPLMSCTTVRNISSVKVNCENGHRTSSKADMLMTEMVRLPCSSRFTVVRPEDGYWEECPKILLICHSPHTHPIPLPTTTPVQIKAEIKALIRSLEHELADMTPRRFCRHPAVINRVKELCPAVEEPTVAHLHPSLANLDHIASYIHNEVKAALPHGTGWDGVAHMKRIQDEEEGTPYIRVIKRMSWHSLRHEWDEADESDDEEGPLSGSDDDCFRLIVCMLPERSQDFLQAKWVQCDISFKRVPGWNEFELVSVDRETNQVLVLCRAFLNSECARAHQILFRAIRSIVRQDTGKDIEYRHLHSPSLEEHRGILHWAADQHRGQAKGLGLHLQDIAREMGKERRDLHEPGRSLYSLGVYEHLHRILRICEAHITRGIASCAVPDYTVKEKMHSLLCVRHPDWDGAMAYIEREGGAAGRAWLNNKRDSKFALQGMCWEKSFIPLSIWQAGDTTTNAVEMSHIDIYREGMPCSLVGGISRARHYDKMRLHIHRVAQKMGVKASYRPTTVVVSVARKYKRTVIHRTRKFNSTDKCIGDQNERLRKSWERYQSALHRLSIKPTDLNAIESAEKHKKAYEKHKQKSLDLKKRLRGQSSGKVRIVILE